MIGLKLLGVYPMILGAIGFDCDDGTSPGPVNLQFMQFFDTGAIQNQETRRTYRNDITRLAGELVDLFGENLNYGFYMYCDKGGYVKNGQIVLGSGCACIPDACSFSGLSSWWKNGGLEDCSFANMKWWENTVSITPRDGRSSLSDAVALSLSLNEHLWNYNDRTSDGLLTVRILFIGTDVAAYDGIDFRCNTTRADWAMGPSDWPPNCEQYNYPESVRHLQPLVATLPYKSTYFIVLSQTSPKSDVDNVREWYKEVYFKEHLGGVKGFSEEMPDTGRIVDPAIDLVKKAVCEVWREANTESQ